MTPVVGLGAIGAGEARIFPNFEVSPFMAEVAVAVLDGTGVYTGRASSATSFLEAAAAAAGGGGGTSLEEEPGLGAEGTEGV